MRRLSDFEGELYGYARVSTEEQNLDMQIDALMAAGVERNMIFPEKRSGRDMDRPELARVIKLMRKGDCLVVWKLDRLGRSALGLAQKVKELEDQGKHFRAIDWDIDTTQPFGKLVFNIMAAIAELESELISVRTKSGMTAARARGKKFGRQHYVLAYPKRLKRFTELWVAGKIHHKGPLMDDHLTAAEVVEAMHKADRKAPKYSGEQSYTNWKQKGFPGFDIEAANVLKAQDIQERSTDG